MIINYVEMKKREEKVKKDMEIARAPGSDSWKEAERKKKEKERKKDEKWAWAEKELKKIDKRFKKEFPGEYDLYDL
ncbi:hypothetical protein LCGC14_2209370, partial [marine sediment metagenome]